MNALRYFDPRDIRCETMDDPRLERDRNAIIKVDRCAICGSDLHIYHGQGISEDIGFCFGHEAVGEVVETGRGVHRLQVGDKVMISAAVGCGACPSCLAGNVANCEVCVAVRCRSLASTRTSASISRWAAPLASA